MFVHVCVCICVHTFMTDVCMYVRVDVCVCACAPPCRLDMEEGGGLRTRDADAVWDAAVMRGPGDMAAGEEAVKRDLEAEAEEGEDGAVVELENVHKTYLLGVEGVPALRGVTLSVHRGEFMIIYGTSGGECACVCVCVHSCPGVEIFHLALIYWGDLVCVPVCVCLCAPPPRWEDLPAQHRGHH